MSVVSGNEGTKIVTKEWIAVWDAMRDHGDEDAHHLLGPLIIKDRFDTSRVALDGCNSDGWTLFHKAALHNCPECGKKLIAAAMRPPKGVTDGSADRGLAFIAALTNNGSAALDISNRWHETSFSKMLNAKKRELEKESKVEADAAEQKRREQEEEDEADGSDYDELDDYNDLGGESKGPRTKGSASVVSVEDEGPHGGRSDAWWALWHAIHRRPQDPETTADMKEFLKTPLGAAEALEVAALAACGGMTLLHQACVNGAHQCTAALLRSGVFPGDPSKW